MADFALGPVADANGYVPPPAADGWTDAEAAAQAPAPLPAPAAEEPLFPVSGDGEAAPGSFFMASAQASETTVAQAGEAPGTDQASEAEAAETGDLSRWESLYNKVAPEGSAADALAPEFLLAGGSWGKFPAMAAPLRSIFQEGGSWALINTKDGSVGNFSAKGIPGSGFSVGGVEFGAAIVGAVGPDGGGQVGGINISTNVPTPVGDVGFFANVVSDRTSLQGMFGTEPYDPETSLNGPGDQKAYFDKFMEKSYEEPVTFGANIGFLYSVTDGMARGAGAVAGAGGASALTSLAAGGAMDLTGLDGQVGAAWYGSTTWYKGEMVSINVSGKEILAQDIPKFVGDEIEKMEEQRAQKPDGLGLNGGSAEAAAENLTRQAIWGASPFALGAPGAAGAAADVETYGGGILDVVKPIYEYGVQYGALEEGEQIRDLAHAGRVIDETLATLRQDGADTETYTEVYNAFLNDYNLDFESDVSMELRQRETDLDAVRPDDYQFVRDVFSGNYRPADVIGVLPKDSLYGQDPRG